MDAPTAAIAFAATGVAGIVAYTMASSGDCCSGNRSGPAPPRNNKSKSKTSKKKKKDAQKQARRDARNRAEKERKLQEVEDRRAEKAANKAARLEAEAKRRADKAAAAAAAAAPKKSSKKKKKKNKKKQAEAEAGWETVEKKEKKVYARSQESETSGDASPRKQRKTFEASVKIELGDAVRAVIGRGGGTIRQLSESSGANINIDKGSSVATITGTKDQVASARAQVESILADQAARASGGGGGRRSYEYSQDIKLGEKVGVIIGKRGATISRISEETGAQLDIERDSGDNMLTIGGTQETVAAAVAEVTRLLESSGDRASGDAGPRGPRIRDGPSETMSLPPRGTFAVIGRGGSQITRITEESGAQLDVDKEQSSVTIYGSPEQIAAAKRLVKAVLATSLYSETMEVGSSVGRIVGRGGSKIRQIQDESGCRLTIKRDDSGAGNNKLIMSGSKEQCATARALVEAVIAEAAEYKPRANRSEVGEGEIKVEMDLGNAVGAVIGRGGSTISTITKTSGARVIIDKGCSTCAIIGTDEQVQAATASVKEIVDRQAKFAERDAAKLNGDATPNGDGGAKTSAGVGGWDAAGDENAQAQEGGFDAPVTGGEGW